MGLGLRTSSKSAGRFLTLLPFAGVCAFLCLYFYAASLYPGGTKLDAFAPGYSHLHNYWCDLLDAVSYSGNPNPGRPFALAATLILPLTFVFLWWFVPGLLGGRGWKRPVIRWSGCVAMVCAVFVYTSHHDRIIQIAGNLALSAFAITLVGLFQARRWFLGSIGVLAFTFALLNTLMWQTGTWLILLPVVQRAAFSSFFLWVSCTSIACFLDAVPSPQAPGTGRGTQT